MKVIFILSHGHSGSTLLDMILGTNKNIFSSGELRYLPWQLYRTQNKIASIENQDICTCLNDFRKCEFWGKVFENINIEKGFDVTKNPELFPISFFGKFKFGQLGPYKYRIVGKITRILLQNNLISKNILIKIGHFREVLNNNWLLFKKMSEVSNCDFIVDSSKDITRALLLQKYKPENVIFLYNTRDIYGYVNSILKNTKGNLSIYQILKKRKKYQKLLDKSKNVKNLTYFETYYEEYAKDPLKFLEEFTKFLKIKNEINYLIKNNIIDTTKMHLVAGNPARYRGKMEIRYDEKWKKELTPEQIKNIKKIKSKYYE